MGKIPTYQPQLQMRVPETPRLPVNVAGGGAEALGKLADTVGALADRQADRSHNLRQVQELNESVIGATSDLFDAMDSELNGVGFHADPEGAHGRYREAAKGIEKSYLERISDPEVRVQFGERFHAEANSNLQKIQTYSRQQREDMAAASLGSSLDRLNNLVPKARDDQDIQLLLGKGVAAIEAMVANGAIKSTEGQKLREQFQKSISETRVKQDIVNNPKAAFEKLQSGGYPFLDAGLRPSLADLAQRRSDAEDARLRQESERSEKQAKERQFQATYQGLRQVFKDDPQGAIDYLSSPGSTGNMPAEDVQRLRSWFSSDASAQESRAAKEQQAIDRQNSDQWLSQMVNGDPPSPYDIQMSSASPGVKEHFLQITQKKAGELDKTDPALHAALLKGIYDGAISSREQILPLIGQGLSPSTAASLVRAVEAPQSKMTDRYKRIAIREFENAFKEDEDMAAKMPEFIIALDQVVEQKKLTGADVIAEARKLMEPYQQEKLRSFLGITWTGEETTYPFLQMDLFGEPVEGSVRRPIPRAQPAVTKRIEQLRADGVSDEKIRGFLEEKGVDPAAYGL